MRWCALWCALIKLKSLENSVMMCIHQVKNMRYCALSVSPPPPLPPPLFLWQYTCPTRQILHFSGCLWCIVWDEYSSTLPVLRRNCCFEQFMTLCKCSWQKRTISILYSQAIYSRCIEYQFGRACCIAGRTYMNLVCFYLFVASYMQKRWHWSDLCIWNLTTALW